MKAIELFFHVIIHYKVQAGSVDEILKCNYAISES